MSKKHGAKQQKKLAKQRAKRQAKRTVLARQSSKDPTVRLQRAETWPVVQAAASAELWDDGIGHLTLARQEPEGGIVFASFLVDVFCLGVKDSFWHAGTMEDFRELVKMMGQTQTMSSINPACLVKIVKGAVEYARSLGFSPHAEYRYTSLLLEGIDPSTCAESFEFGRDGKPLYIRGPNETAAQAMAIVERMREVGGDFVMPLPRSGDVDGLDAIEDDADDDEEDAGSQWIWKGPGPGGQR